MLQCPELTYIAVFKKASMDHINRTVRLTGIQFIEKTRISCYGQQKINMLLQKNR